MKTKAAILVEQNKPLVIDDIEMPALGAGQVRVNILTSGICGSQIGEIEGRKGKDPFLPHLLGHEACGIVEEIGAGVTHVKPSDKVVLHWRPGNGLEAETPSYRWGNRTVNAGRVTTFEDAAIVSENRLTKISLEEEPATAMLYGCCIPSGFGVLFNDAKLQKGESVIILGTGGMGLSEIIAARLAAAAMIIAVDIHEHKLVLAAKLGATHTIHSKRTDVREAVRHWLGDRGVDVVIENTGVRSLIEMAYDLAAAKGRTILVGVPKTGEKASFDTLPLHFGKILIGSHGGGAQPAEDIPRYLRMQHGGLFDPAPIISHSYPLERINEAIESLRSGQAVRCAITMKAGKDA